LTLSGEAAFIGRRKPSLHVFQFRGKNVIASPEKT